jgi:hypothetical protein
MTDELNLVPTNNLEKHLDNILRAASGDEPQYDLAPNWRVEQYLAAIAAKLSGGGLPHVTETDNGKVLTAEEGAWTPLGELQGANNLIIEANVEQDGSLSTNNTINYLGALYLFNRGCLFVDIYRNDGLEQKVKCDFATDLYDGLSWIFRGDYLDTLSGKPKTIAVRFTPPRSPDAAPASITITNIDANNRFIVTLTPTAQDYSGTMDKTIAEIDAAYKAGRQVVFHLLANASQWYEMDSTERGGDSNTYPSYNACGIVGTVFAKFYTGTTDDGTKQTYATNIYTLTPAT